MPAATPCPVVRMLTGNTSEGSTNVVMFGPELDEEVAQTEDREERRDVLRQCRHDRQEQEACRHDCEAEELQAPVPDAVHLRHGEEIAGDREDDEHRQ